jgi:hypothetical protein
VVTDLEEEEGDDYDDDDGPEVDQLGGKNGCLIYDVSWMAYWYWLI